MAIRHLNVRCHPPLKIEKKRKSFSFLLPRSSKHGGSSGGGNQQRFGLPALELHRLRPPQRLQPALLPGRQLCGPEPRRPAGGVSAQRAAGEELHQCVGDPEEGKDPAEQSRTEPNSPAKRSRTSTLNIEPHIARKLRLTKNTGESNPVPDEPDFKNPACFHRGI